MRILIVEDEYSLANVIKDKLIKEKYLVDIANDGENGLYNALMGIYDLIILDVMLPKINGFDILKKLRQENITSKIIMLTAKSEIDDKLEGLTQGADDYMTKPFHLSELVARINIQLRKEYNHANDKSLSFNDIKLDIANSKLICTHTNEEVDMICKELQLLEYLINNKQNIVSKDQIIDKVWGIDNEAQSNNVEAYISFIRRKLKAIGSSTMIKAIRGLGYRLEVQDEETKN